MDGRSQVFERLTELYKSRTFDEKARRARSRVRFTWRSKVYRLGFGCRGAATNVRLQTDFSKFRIDVFGACNEVNTRVAEKCAVVSEEEGQSS
jgi:hypothetical protein